MEGFDSTLQNFIYKHTIDLENIQRNKKKEEIIWNIKLAQTRFYFISTGNKIFYYLQSFFSPFRHESYLSYTTWLSVLGDPWCPVYHVSSWNLRSFLWAIPPTPTLRFAPSKFAIHLPIGSWPLYFKKWGSWNFNKCCVDSWPQWPQAIKLPKAFLWYLCSGSDLGWVLTFISW
jgi:hypothetical protein